MLNKSQADALRKKNLKPLTSAEQSELETLEADIIVGKESFLRVGLALTRIRDQKLYRQHYSTFEEYCDKKWGLSGRQGYRLIEASSINATSLSRFDLTAHAAGQLAKVPEAKRPGIMERIKASRGKVTAQAIKTEISKAPIKRNQDATSRPVFKGPMDDTGIVEVPAESIDLWNKGKSPDGEPKKILSMLREIKRLIEAGQERNEPLFGELDYTTDIAAINGLILDMKRAIPCAVCHSCNGKRPDGCQECRRRGFYSKWYLLHCITEEIRVLKGCECVNNKWRIKKASEEVDD